MPPDQSSGIATAAHRTKILTEKETALILLHKLPLRCSHGEAAGFRDFLVDPITLREAIGLPEQGAVHPKRAAHLLRLSPGTVSALLEHRHLDGVWVKRQAPMRPVSYICPSSIDIFAEMYVAGKELAEHRAGREDPLWMDDRLSNYRLDLGENTEPIYRREVLDII